MRKIVTLFNRDFAGNRQVINEVTPAAEWVIAGEGVATLKIDGTCTKIEDGVFFKRHEVKRGKIAPAGFVPAQAPDAVTGDTPGWAPVGDGPEDRYHREARTAAGEIADGTYELVGPKVQGNPGGYATHQLVRHGSAIMSDVPRDFDGLRRFFEDLYARGDFIEGVVFWRKEGDNTADMVKIKARDFGIKPPRTR